MTTNYTGMVNVSQTALPCMLKRNAGDFIVYGSVAGRVVDSVEKCLGKGVEISFPGPAKLIRILHAVFPNLVA